MIDYTEMCMYLARVGLYRLGYNAKLSRSLRQFGIPVRDSYSTTLENAFPERRVLLKGARESGQLPDRADEHTLSHRPSSPTRNYI